MAEQHAAAPLGQGSVYTGEEWIPAPNAESTLALACAGMAYTARRVRGLDAAKHEQALARVLAAMCPERLGELIESATLIAALGHIEASRRPDPVRPWCRIPLGGDRG